MAVLLPSQLGQSYDQSWHLVLGDRAMHPAVCKLPPSAAKHIAVLPYVMEEKFFTFQQGLWEQAYKFLYTTVTLLIESAGRIGHSGMTAWLLLIVLHFLIIRIFLFHPSVISDLNWTEKSHLSLAEYVDCVFCSHIHSAGIIQQHEVTFGTERSHFPSGHMHLLG